MVVKGGGGGERGAFCRMVNPQVYTTRVGSTGYPLHKENRQGSS